MLVGNFKFNRFSIIPVDHCFTFHTFLNLNNASTKELVQLTWQVIVIKKPLQYTQYKIIELKMIETKAMHCSLSYSPVVYFHTSPINSLFTLLKWVEISISLQVYHVRCRVNKTADFYLSLSIRNHHHLNCNIPFRCLVILSSLSSFCCLFKNLRNTIDRLWAVVCLLHETPVDIFMKHTAVSETGWRSMNLNGRLSFKNLQFHWI